LYEELPKETEYEHLRELAHSVLEQRSIWWEPAYARTILSGAERQLDPIYFRIRIETITGRRATL
jgi:nitroimidazol reductase NimA-like FMN-containing flavoprotein (pyridoxamine 5'-phosphate oxidase superfamily)